MSERKGERKEKGKREAARIYSVNREFGLFTWQNLSRAVRSLVTVLNGANGAPAAKGEHLRVKGGKKETSESSASETRMHFARCWQERCRARIDHIYYLIEFF